MIEVRHISKHFGRIRAVDDISFTVQKGERFVLLGTSGCGKTTTLKMINRLIEPDAGEIWINGEPNDKQPPELLRRQMGYVLQDTGLFPHYTIAQNISVVPDLLKWEKNKILTRTKTLLEKFQMSPAYLPMYPDQLSGGQQQRVGFTRALMADPPILLMDEPLGALDPITRSQMQKEFKQLNELKGKTIIMVTHDISEAIELGDRICVMDKGRIQQTGSAIELLLQPSNDFVRNFFSHDRFLLQVKALHLKDIIGYLPSETSGAAGEIHLTTDASVLEAMEQLGAGSLAENKINIADGKDSRIYSFTLTDLLAAFQQKINAF